MNKKSFMRGFGTGVLFTAIILGVSCLIRTSDSQVVSRAKKLGMVYEKDAGNQKVAQADKTAAPTDQKETEAPKATKEADASQKTEAPKATKEADASKKTEAPKATEPVTVPTPEKEDTKPEETKAPKKTTKESTSIENEKKKLEKEKENLKKEAAQTSKNLEIKAGEWSSDVSKRLQSMGIIKNATDFDKYLNDHGYSASISAGTYKVSPGDTYQELARKITRR